MTGVVMGPPATPASSVAGVAPKSLFFRNQPLGDRAADDAADHQPKRRRRHGELHDALDVVHVREALGIGHARAMPAHERDRAGDQPKQGMQPKSLRNRDAECILDEQERKQHDQEAHQPNTALRQQPHIGRHADAGEKHQEKT